MFKPVLLINVTLNVTDDRNYARHEHIISEINPSISNDNMRETEDTLRQFDGLHLLQLVNNRNFDNKSLNQVSSFDNRTVFMTEKKSISLLKKLPFFAIKSDNFM